MRPWFMIPGELMLAIMNVRQRSFAELVASGMPASRAYFEAGYSGKGNNAEAHACRLMAHPEVMARITEIQAETREMSLMSKRDKIRILESIIRSATTRTSDKLTAIKLHNDMTGDNQPTVSIVEAGPNLLDAVRERAKSMASVLSLAHEALEKR